LRVSTLSRAAVLEEVGVSLQGVTENVGNGGVCLLADRPLPLNSVLRCQLTVADAPMDIPTLMSVRWLRRLNGGNNYKLGLQFLL
jgi:PilZ domain